MARINRVPRGLTSLLGTKALGRNPQELLEAVTPTVDLTQFYATEATLQSVANAEILFTPAVGTVYAAEEIPAGEAWLVYSITVKLVATAAINVNLVPVLVLPTNITNVQQQLTSGVSPLSLTATNQAVVVRDYDQPRLLGAGAQIGAYCTNAVAPGTNALTAITSIAYVPVEV